MRERAYVLISCLANTEKKVRAALEDKNFIQVNQTLGVYDFFVIIEGKNLEELQSIVSTIRAIRDITTTTTLRDKDLVDDHD